MKNLIACGYTIPITLFGIPPSPADHLKSMEIVGKAGFRAMELELYDELIPFHRHDVKPMKTVLDRYGMSVPSVMAVQEQMFSTDQVQTSKSVSDFDAITDLVCELGSPLVSICGYMPPEIRPQGTELYTGGPPTAVFVNDQFSWTAFWDHAVQMVGQFDKIAKTKGLTLLIETRSNDWIGSVGSIMNLISGLEFNQAGVILDVAHVHAGKEYLPLTIRKLGSLIKLVHLSDNDSSQAFHLPPGRGNIDFPTVFHTLKLIGFEGPLVIDISGVENIVDEAVAAREYFQSILGSES